MVKLKDDETMEETTWLDASNNQSRTGSWQRDRQQSYPAAVARYAFHCGGGAALPGAGGGKRSFVGAPCRYIGVGTLIFSHKLFFHTTLLHLPGKACTGFPGDAGATGGGDIDQ